MKQLFLLIIFLGNFSCITYSQLIKRFSAQQFEFINKQMNAQVKKDIFTDFAWLAPDFKSNKVLLEEKAYFFMMNEAGIQIREIDSDFFELKGNGNYLLVSREFSKNNIYYDRNILQKRATIINKWCPNFLFGSTKINWSWGACLDSVLTIPSYPFYPFLLRDNSLFYLYEVLDSIGHKNYYLQNASYVLAVDGNGVKYILLDADCNGSYTDGNDKILFNTWNPYQKESGYKKLPLLKENFWYNQSYLNNTFFLTFHLHHGKFYITDENSIYSSEIKKGVIHFTKIPNEATLFINDTSYQLHKGTTSFECEYGKYNARIYVKGFKDFETAFTINDSNSNTIIRYPKTSASATVSIKNIPSTSFIITIKNTSGQNQVLINSNTFSVSNNINDIEIYCDGYNLKCSIDVLKNNFYEIDFREELKIKN